MSVDRSRSVHSSADPQQTQPPPPIRVSFQSPSNPSLSPAPPPLSSSSHHQREDMQSMPTLTSMHSVNEGGAAGGNSNTNNNHNGNTFTVSNPLSRMRSNMNNNSANNNGNQAGMIARSSFRSRMQGRLGAVVRSVAHASNSAGGNGNGGGGGGGGGLDGTVSSLGGANHNFMESDALFGPSFFSQQSRQRSFSRSNNNFAGSNHQQHQHHQQQHGNRVAATNFLQSGGSVNATSVDMTGDFFAEAGAATAVSTSISVNGTSTATISGTRPAPKPSISSSSSPQASTMTVNEVSAVAVPSPSAGPAMMIPPQQIPVVDEFDSEGDDDDDGAAGGGGNLHSSGSGAHDIPNRLASFATTLVPSGSSDTGGVGGGSANRKKVLLSGSGNLANSGNGAHQISNVGTSTTLLSPHRRDSDAIVMARTASSIPLTRPARKHPTAHLKLQQQQQNGPISSNHHINSPHNSSSLTASHGDNTTTPHANSAAEKMEGSWGVGSAENPLSGASFEQHESYHQEAQSGVQRIFNMVDVENRGWLSAEQVVKALRLFGMYVTVEEVLSMAEELLEIDELHQQQKMMQSESPFPSEHTWKRKSIALSSERRGFFGEGTMGRSMTLRPNETDNQFDFDDDGIAASMRRPTGKPSVSVEDSACVDPPPASLLPSPSHRSRKQGSSVKRHKQHHKVCVDFPMFEQIIRLWQGAARYRLFQDRAVESQAHMDSALDQYKHWIPDSTMMWFWQVWILLLSLYCFIVALCTHMYDASDPADAVMLTHLFYVTTTPDFFVTFFFAADIVVKFCSMVLEIDEHHNLLIVDDTKTIVRRYLFSVWFWIDLMSVLPLRFFFLFGGKSFELADTTVKIAATDRMMPSGIGCVQSTCANFEQLQAVLLAAKIATHFRVLKYFTHTTFFQESKLIPVSKLYILLFHVLAQGLIDMTRLVALTHLCAVVNVTFHMSGEKSIRPSTTQGPNPSSYVESLYVLLYMFSTCGYGDVGPTSRAHEIYYMFLMIVGMLINALLIGTIVTYLQRSDIENDRRTKLLEVSALMRYFHVPKSLEEEVLSFENYILQNDLLRTHSDKIGELPMDLQRNLELCTRLRTVQALPYIQDVHHSAKLQLCNLLVKVTYCPEEYVVYCGEVGEEMFFLNHGYVDIFAQNMLIATLKPGHYFGEMALISQEPLQRAADVKAITYCECYVLEKICFLEVALRYPRLRVAISQVAAVRMQAIHDNQGPPSISEAIGAAHSPSDSERRDDVSRKSYALTEGMAWLLSEFHPSGREPSGDFVKAESPGAVGFGSDIDDASNEHPNGSHETGPLESHENEEDQASHRLVAVTSGVMMPSGPSFHLDLRPKKDQSTVGQEVHTHPGSEGTPAPVMAMRTTEGHSELFGGETPPEDAPPSPPQSSLPPPLPLVVTTTTATATTAGAATTLTHVLPMSPTSPTSGSSSLKSANRLSPRTNNNNNNTTAGGAVKRTSGSGLIDGSASPPIAALAGWTNVAAVPSAGGGGFQSHASSSTSAAKLASTTSERPDAVRVFSPGSSSTALHFVMSSEAFANHGGVHPIAPPFGAHVAASNVAGGGVDPMETTTTNGSRNLVGRSAVANRLRRRSEHTMEMSMVRSSLPGYLDRSFVPAQLGTSSAHIAHADRVVASTPVAALGGASFTPAVLAAGYRSGVTAVPVGSGAVSPLMAADDLRTTEQLIAAHHAQQFDHMLDQIVNENRAVAELLLQLEAGKHAQRQSP